MRAYAKNLHGRNHRYSQPESTRVPKSSDDRKGTRSAVRQIANKELSEDVLSEPIESEE